MKLKHILFVILGILAVIAAWYLYQEFLKWQELREKATKTLGKAEKALDVGEGVKGVITKPIEGIGKIFD